MSAVPFTMLLSLSPNPTHPSTPSLVILELGLCKSHFLVGRCYVSGSAVRECTREAARLEEIKELAPSCLLPVYLGRLCSSERLPGNFSLHWQQQFLLVAATVSILQIFPTLVESASPCSLEDPNTNRQSPYSKV